MSRALTILAGIALLAAAMLARPTTPGRLLQPGTPADRHTPQVTFSAIDIFVDPGQTPLGAYQIEVKAVAAAGGGSPAIVRLVGVEGGDGAYKSAPYYDPAALHENQLRDRIIIAAFSIAATLPTGRTRVARLHIEVTGPAPTYSLTLTTAGAADGRRIDAKVTYSPVEAAAPAGPPGDGR